MSTASVPNNNKHTGSARSPRTLYTQPTNTSSEDPRALHLQLSGFLSFAMYQQFSVATSSDYGQMIMPASAAGPSTIAPHATTTTAAIAPSPAQQKPQPLVATGDWTTELVQLAKTAELK